MDIKIMVAAHKPYWMPDDNTYLPIHVGKALHEDLDLGYTGDDTGDNISEKNPHYCELTAIYWAWKNLQADYAGLVHYRRYFTNKEVHDSRAKRQQVLTTADWEKLLAKAPVVVPDKRRYYIESNESHYLHAHHPEGLTVTRQIVQELYPDYMPAYDLVMHRTWAHMFNMFVMRKDLYDQYCEWLFAILGELERRVDISSYTPYEARIYGFVSELLLDVWLEHNHIPYVEQNVSFMEPQNWLKKGTAFLWRKLNASNRGGHKYSRFAGLSTNAMWEMHHEESDESQVVA